MSLSFSVPLSSTYSHMRTSRMRKVTKFEVLAESICQYFFTFVIFLHNIIDGIQAHIPIERRRFLIDVTFKVCPYGPFNRFLIIYVDHLEETIPFLFMLMSRKTQAAYLHLFKTNILDMECQTMTTDFERAMRNALMALYPKVKFNLCWFHFTQAVKRRAMQTPQLLPYIRKHREAEIIYYKLMSNRTKFKVICHRTFSFFGAILV